MTVEQNEFLSSVQLQILAEQAIKQYPNEYQGSVKLLCQSENATFLVTTAQAKYALRIHRPNYHHLQDIESELAWLDALNQSGIEVPLAIADQDGQRVITLKLAEGISRTQCFSIGSMAACPPPMSIRPLFNNWDKLPPHYINTVKAGNAQNSLIELCGIMTPWSVLKAIGATGNMHRI